ncbi:lycopene cyclase family protein [Streptomyces sp. NPDC007088]|uniref:lycopene cyclase family protein n=1 Tax=Streptomyces sp. NPDC007088 TaxID=3364773 RepID=UPI00367AF405
MDADVVIVGAGAAGLSLAHRLCRPRPGPRRPAEVVLVDAPPGPLRPSERTWCFWEPPGGEFDGALAAAWDHLRVRAHDGRTLTRSPAGLRYKMLRSGAFEEHVDPALAGAPGFRRHDATVEDIRGGPHGARVHGLDASGRPWSLRARWVFDSRPLPALPASRATLFQHFRGWFVRTAEPAFDATAADLMDFRTPQPPHGLSFGYVLPLNDREALVEYTEFSRAPLGVAAYEAALRHYTQDVLRLGAFEVTAAEQGLLPMTAARFARAAGPSVFRIGAAGGATRPSTGYTFAAVQRQTRAVADRYHRGAVPAPPAPHAPRARAMDAVLLRALDQGRVRGADFFCDLFAGVPAERVLRFLDGRTTVWEDLGVGLRVPRAPMLRTALELPFVRPVRTPLPR